jgi:peptidoglycan/xylan/chitin deacetylase (PgdA/CDA1 family)
VFILNFHGLGEPLAGQNQVGDGYWTDPHFFAAVLGMVRNREDVSVTFDDAYESDYSIALPLLKASKMNARFFVVAGRVGQKGFLSRKQIQTLSAEGMTIGSHGMYHRKWRGLSDHELREELVEARDLIEQITGSRIAQAACPFGGYDRRVLQHLRKAGYDRVYTSDGGPANRDSWIQPRNTIVRGDDLQKVLSILNQAPSGPKLAWRQLKLSIKRLR